jgi:hypothetical protein
MARTYTQIRHLAAQQTGMFFTTGTTDSSGGATTVLRDGALTRYGDDRLNGHHILLTSGSPTYTELFIRDFFQADGDAVFRPELAGSPDSLTYEILPFSGTDFLEATQTSIYELYDRGFLSRHFWMRGMGGSPLYNADFSSWSSSTAIDGWTASSSSVARERASENLAMSETSARLHTAIGYIGLDAKWQRYLLDYKGNNVTLYCWVKTSAGSNARLNFYNGSNNYSSYHGGGGDWELLHVTVDTSETDTAFQPRLHIDTTSEAYFNMPWVKCQGFRVREYPFVISLMPDGPYELLETTMGIEENEVASGRGLGSIRQVGKSRPMVDYRLVKHHDENASTQVGTLDFGQSRAAPSEGRLMWLRGDGPLTVPTSVLSTDSLEVTETESLMLATFTAIRLIERGMAGAPSSTRRAYSERLTNLHDTAVGLIAGAGQARDTATYSLGW